MIGLDESTGGSGCGSGSEDGMSMISSPAVEPFSDGAADVAGVDFLSVDRAVKASNKEVWRDYGRDS